MRSETKQTFHLGEFEGPLDLLLFLIKKAEINIYDIPIAEIIEQYLEYLGYLTKKDLDNLTDFYVMAATLLYIKSRMLLPVEVEFDDDFEDPRKELVDKLIEYQKFRKISDMMFAKSVETEWVLDRTRKQRSLPFPDDDGQWDQLDVWDLLKTFSSIITNLTTERIIDLYEEVSVNEKISLLYELLETKKEFAFTDLLIHSNSIMEIVCAFLAILESIKSKRISIYQNKFFGDIEIRQYSQGSL